jgi:hypothetical protein
VKSDNLLPGFSIILLRILQFPVKKFRYFFRCDEKYFAFSAPAYRLSGARFALALTGPFLPIAPPPNFFQQFAFPGVPARHDD